MRSEDLECKFECQDLLTSFGSALDRGANLEAASFFTDDAVLVRPDGESRGPEVREFLLKRSPQIVTRHILTNIRVVPAGSDTARASAYVVVYRLPASPNDVLPRRLPDKPTAAGDWLMDFRKTPEGWRISRYEAVAVLVAEQLSGTGPGNSPASSR